MITVTGAPAAREIVGEVGDGVNLFHSIRYNGWSSEYGQAVLAPSTSHIDATIAMPEATDSLSLYTPHGFRAGDDRPVLVFIHGGSYQSGSHAEAVNAANLAAEHGIVVVCIGYRLHVEGFARFHDDEPNHYRGTDDAVIALEWVQRNIEAFGGDPTNVTLMGHSAGAGMALWITRRDHYRGGFRRVLCCSPAFPRATYEDRKGLLRASLGKPLTREGLEKASKKTVERGYNRFRRLMSLDVAMGPAPWAPTELADVPIVLTFTHDEMYDLPACRVPDGKGIGGTTARMLSRSMGMKPGAYQQWAQAASAIDPEHLTGLLTTDSSILRWVDQTAEGDEHALWLAQFIGAGERRVYHGDELDPLFDGLFSARLAAYAAGQEPNWPRYTPERTCLDVAITDGSTAVETDPLAYVRAAFNA